MKKGLKCHLTREVSKGPEMYRPLVAYLQREGFAQYTVVVGQWE